MSDVAEALGALSLLLRARGLRWYVFGGQAAIAYGSSRVTQDIDVTVEVADTASFVRALSAGGFASRARDLEELARFGRVLPIVHERSGVPIDVVLAGAGIEAQFLANARDRMIANLTVPVAAAEDIVTMKLLAARPTDREDVVAILRAQRGNFDETRVRDMLTMLDEALEQGDLVPSFEEALKRAGHR